ncbi:MAG: hypothetical protein ABSA32_13590 [Candidatus Acidiferrales bacterium]|jgi:hypothetical protein
MARLTWIAASAIFLIGGSASLAVPLHARPDSGPGDDQTPTKSDTLQEESRLALIRFVDGEFVKVVAPLPAGKTGFHLKAGEPLDARALQMVLAGHDAAANPGDKVQITRLQFKERQIAVQINGGGNKGNSWRDHVQLDVGGVGEVVGDPNVTSVTAAPGATLYLDFNRPLPDMTPDELKKYLSVMLDFGNEHSAAVQWVQTLPPETQKAIADKRALPGMSRDEVIAALGKPDHKVRETQPDGTEVEDWIYGTPPGKTVFVSFDGDIVLKVEEFP